MGIKKGLSIAILLAMGFAGASVLPNIINPKRNVQDNFKCGSTCVSNKGNCDGINPRCVTSDLSKIAKINNDLESAVDTETKQFNYINFRSTDIPEMVVEAANYYGTYPSYTLALADGESSFNPEAISYKNAYGVMQVILNTARRYVPDITPEELLDPNKNIPIGVAHFSYLVKRYGEYRLAIAAYHTGETNLDNAIGALKAAKAGNNHYDIFGYRDGEKVRTRTIEVSHLRNLPDNWDGYKIALKKITGNDAKDTIDHVDNVWEIEFSNRST